jgi:hypothetical protein
MKRIIVQVSLGKKRELISKITRAKWVGGVARVVQGLPSKCESLNSNPSTIEEKEGKKEEKREGMEWLAYSVSH